MIVSDAPLVKIRAATAAEVCAHFDLKPEAQPLLHPRMPPRQFIDALLANKQYLAGIEFLAHNSEEEAEVTHLREILKGSVGFTN